MLTTGNVFEEEFPHPYNLRDLIAVLLAVAVVIVVGSLRDACFKADCAFFKARKVMVVRDDGQGGRRYVMCNCNVM